VYDRIIVRLLEVKQSVELASPLPPIPKHFGKDTYSVAINIQVISKRFFF